MNFLKEHIFYINGVLFEYSIIDFMIWCTINDSNINYKIPYFQSADKIIEYLKELGIEEKDLIEIEKITFKYLI